MSTDLEEAIAAVLTQHELEAPNGGPSSLAWCKCSCGHRSEMWGGTRDWAKDIATRHVAREISNRLEQR